MASGDQRIMLKDVIKSLMLATGEMDEFKGMQKRCVSIGCSEIGMEGESGRDV